MQHRLAISASVCLYNCNVTHGNDRQNGNGRQNGNDRQQLYAMLAQVPNT